MQRCATCDLEFDGRPNRLYCSRSCRSRKERERHDWDVCHRNLTDPKFATELVPGFPLDGEHLAQAIRWRDYCLETLGERP